jgi:HSP20 family protein
MTRSDEKGGQVVSHAPRTATPYERMDPLFNGMWARGLLSPLDRGLPLWGELDALHERMPRVDVIEKDDVVLVRAELPGMKREELEVSLAGDYLTIRAESVTEKKEEGEYHRAEIHRGTFSRVVALPVRVDAEKAEASFRDGVLEIRIPRAEAVRKHAVEIH